MKEKESSQTKFRLVKDIEITPVKPNAGLVGFCTFILYEALYCSSVAIYTRLSGGFRLVYPQKAVNGKQMDIFHPINPMLGKKIEIEVTKKLRKLDINN